MSKKIRSYLAGFAKVSTGWGFDVKEEGLAIAGERNLRFLIRRSIKGIEAGWGREIEEVFNLLGFWGIYFIGNWYF